MAPQNLLCARRAHCRGLFTAMVAAAAKEAALLQQPRLKQWQRGVGGLSILGMAPPSSAFTRQMVNLLHVSISRFHIRMTSRVWDLSCQAPCCKAACAWASSSRLGQTCRVALWTWRCQGSSGVIYL